MANLFAFMYSAALAFQPSKVRKAGGGIKSVNSLTGTVDEISEKVTKWESSGEIPGPLTNFPVSWDKPYQGFFFPTVVTDGEGKVTDGIQTLGIAPTPTGLDKIIIIHGYHVDKDGNPLDKRQGEPCDELLAYIQQSFLSSDVRYIVNNRLFNVPIPITATMRQTNKGDRQNVNIDFSRMASGDTDNVELPENAKKMLNTAQLSVFKTKFIEAGKPTDEVKVLGLISEAMK